MDLLETLSGFGKSDTHSFIQSRIHSLTQHILAKGLQHGRHSAFAE